MYYVLYRAYQQLSWTDSASRLSLFADYLDAAVVFYPMMHYLRR